jgi:hypothetical protein
VSLELLFDFFGGLSVFGASVLNKVHITIDMKSLRSGKRSSPAALDRNALGKMNNANRILSAEGAVPDLVLPAEFERHDDSLLSILRSSTFHIPTVS